MGLRSFLSERAQGTVEFAVIIPVVALMFLGALDFARFLYYDDAVTSAARAGAEAAINHCTSRVTCGISETPTSDAWIVQATACDALPTITLNPQPTTCSSCLTASCSATDPCSATCLSNVCQQDICISPSGTGRTIGSDVTVSVGYNFQPITPLIAPFFNTTACWTGDPSSNKHTLCANATGSIS